MKPVSRTLPALFLRSRALNYQTLGRLRYSHLVDWGLSWYLFVGAGPGGAYDLVPFQPVFNLSSLGVMACWRCSGLPQYPAESGRKGLQWVHELREMAGRPKLWSNDHTAAGGRGKADAKTVVTAGNVSEGDW